jgi:excinuclease ABC subunit A
MIIEHNLDIIRNADYILDLGPEGGEGGGRIIAHGTPEQVATVAGSYTAEFLARHYTPAQLAGSRNGTSHAGPQPANIRAAADPEKMVRGKFAPPEKKTGVPTARASKLAETESSAKPKKATSAKKAVKTEGKKTAAKAKKKA